MNKLLLVGNGFDLAHGLKTSYKDFIKWYFKKCLIASAHRPYQDCMIYVNKTDYYFGLPYNKDIDIYIEELYSTNLENCVLPSIKINGGTAVLKNPFEIKIKSELLQVLFRKCSCNSWVEVENEFYELLKKTYQISGNDVDQKLKDLNNSLATIICELEKYLLTQKPDNLIDDYRELFSSSIKTNDIVNYGSGTRRVGKTMALNFNYTSTIEQYINIKPNNIPFLYYNVNYIHGQLGNANNPMIFGFGDEHDEFYKQIEQEKNKGFLKYIKSFWYFKTDNYHNLLRFIEEDKYQIVILGHSCGLSDRTMLNMLFEHENCASIKIYYYDDGNGYNNHEDLTYEISKHFKDKQKMRRVIVPKSKSSPMPQVKSAKSEVSSNDVDITLN